MIYTQFFIFAIGFLAIIKSADIFTAASEAIAVFFRIPRLIIGLTIVSLATTMPEFTVSALSSYMGIGSVALGNATGSCLANIGLILAVAAMLRPVQFERRVVFSEWIFLILAALGVMAGTADGKLSRGEGLFLCLALVGFFTVLIRRELRARRRSEPAASPVAGGSPMLKSVGAFLLGAGGVVLSAKYAIIPAGVKIAAHFGVPEIVIALSMIAIGTSLPELVTAVIASIKNMGELAAGNVIGANILNLLWVLGASSLIRPLPIDIQTRLVTMPLVIVSALIVFICVRSRFVLGRLQGAGLLAMYIGYLVYVFKFAYN